MEVEIDILQYLKQIEEENKGRSASKVSKIATMFQFPCENDDRDEKDGSGPTVTVVRTESHVARFNTARALFEKMAEKKSEEKSSTKVVTHQRRTCGAQLVGHHSSRSTPSPAYRKASSRSPSPASSHSIHHQPNGHHSSNSFKSSNPSPISTITSSYTPTPTSFHASIQNPSIPSVLPLSVRSTLDSDVYKDKHHHHHHPLNTDVRISNVDVRNKPKDESHTSGRDLIGTGNRYINNELIDEGYNDILRKHEHSTGRKSETKNRPNSLIKPDKPAKPETLIDKPLSSHLQNQQIIQRHKNWFQSFSKTKSPLTSPQKPHEPTSPSFRTANVYEQRSQCEEPPSVHNDWRKERSAILKGSGRNNRQEVEVKNPSDVNVKSFEDVSTLPSCWSPPKQYNELSTSKGDKDSGYSSSAVLSTPCEDYRRDPSPSHVDRNEVESKTYIITDISKDSKSLNRERKHNHGDPHDTKHIAGVFKKGNETVGSSDGGRSSMTSVSKREVANRSSVVDDDNALRQNVVVLRHRDDLPTDKELRLKEWEKRLSQRDSFHEGSGERIVADISSSSSSSSGVRVDRTQYRDSTLERRERKRLEEEHDNKRLDAEKNRKDVRKMEENSVQQRISGDEEREIRKRKLQIEKERLVKDEDERSRLRKEERRERLRKEDHKEEERDRHAREEQGKERLMKEHDERERMRLTEEQEKIESFRREDEKRESFRRDEEKRASLRREMERKEQKRESLRREKEKQERIRREEENERSRREEEERERLRRDELERERIQKEDEEKEKLRREEEERERSRREKEERERLRREKEERERLRREKEERERLRMEEREKLRREEEERERLRREEEERERLKREEEMERLRREKEERTRLKREKEERERLKREEEERERLRREEEERKRLREEEERERLREEEEKERLKREDKERERLKREEERERLKREEEEREKLRREEEEREKLRREEEEEREKLRREEEEKERLKREKEERMREKERLRREEEEKERLRIEMKEKEKLRKEKEERERLRREEKERERLRREEQEKERMRLEEELMERLRKEKEENERLKREEEEREMLRRKEEERLRREEKERERLRKEAVEKERLRREAEERELIRMEEEERERLRRVAAEKERLKREAEERLRREEEERERLRQAEIKRREEMEKERLRKEEEEREVLRREEEREKMREAEEKEEIERKWHAKREKLEEEERIRREKDRVEIEKTKKRIAELKKERDEIQRQQAMRLRMLMKDENGEAIQDLDQFRDASPDDEEVVEEVAEVHYPVRTLPGPRTSVHSSPSKDTVKTTHESQTHKTTHESQTHELITSESQCRNGTSQTNAKEVDETISNLPLPMTQNSEQSTEQIPEGLEQNSDDLAYDHTVLSAQHKLEFCTSSYNDSICKESAEKNGASNLDQFSSSTLSSEFEPLPPPVPPHNVDPATLATKACLDQQRLPPLPIDSELPEPMTPEEAEKLLSHNIIETKKGLLAEAGELDSSRATSSAQPPYSAEEEICRQEVDTEKSTKTEQDDPFDKDYDSVCVDSPTPDNEDDGDDSYGYFKHELTEDGFVVRAKEVLSEDGVHYLEDGHFWIQVPGLAEDDDDDLPESVPVHQHTKLKFSKDPIKLFSTFSVSDYDRRNDDVDPVAASAEYELEKRVEKMNVFPVCIEKGESGLGLSIIGMGVGADAGVEKLGIFVKTITPGGATANDGMIQVNDQIIEVDNQSLVGVTQMFAASVLKNTSGTVNFLIGRENDPENSEVAMLIRQSLMADQERDERRRALEGPNYDPRNSTGIFESFSSQSGGDSPSEDTPRNSYIQQRDVGHPDHLYGGQEFGDQYGDIYGSCSSSPPDGVSSTPPEAFNHDVEGRELLLQNNEMIIMSQHLQEIQHRNDMYEEEITILRNKIGELEKDLGSTTDMARKIQETTKKLKEVEDTLQARQAEIATYQDMLEQSQGQYIILEKKYYKAKKIIKEYQSRERDFLHREEYHITQLEEKDALYNSLVKALKDRVIQLEGDLIKAQQEAGLPVKLPPDLNSQSSNFVHSKVKDNQSSLQKNPPRKPSTINNLDADLSDTEAGDTHTSEGSKCSTVERKIPSKEELDVAVPPTELLDNSFSKAKGELASRGGLANRQLPSLKKSSSNASANSFEHSFDDVVDDSLPESQHQLQVTSSSSMQSKSTSSTTTFHSEESIIHSSSSTSVTSTGVGTQSSAQGNVVYGSRTQPPPPYQATHSQSNQTPAHPPSPHHQPPPYQPPPSAPLSYRPGMPSDPQSGRNEAPYRHPPPIARVQPVNRVEAVPSPLSLNNQQHQQTLAHQLKALLAEREGNSEAMQEGNKEHHTAMKKSPSSLMEDVRRAVIQADMSIGKKPVISGPIHVSSTAQVVSTGQFVHNRTSPQKAANVGAAFQQKINRDSGSWSPVINASSSPVGGGVVLLSQRPIDSSLPVAQSNEAGDGLARKELVSHDSTSSFDAQSLDRFPVGRPPKEILSVFDWTKEQVAQWLVVQGLENYVSTFVSAGITGPRLINIDTKDLKNLGLSSDDKTRIKKKVKELRQNLEKERKQMEKENKEREKLQRKAEKLAEKAERRKK